MPNLVQLLFGFKGRISRKSWWLGTVILLVLALGAGVAYAPQAFGLAIHPLTIPNWIDVLVQLIFTYCQTVLTVKRFNDRNWPFWLGYILFVLGVIQLTGEQLGYFSDDMGTPALVFMIVSTLYYLFALIDNGFLRGTTGPNRYGPDPLQQEEPAP